ncbi:peroxisome assembly protein 26 [Rhinophrynus dorsalis]
MAVTENESSCSLSAMWDWSHLSVSGTPPAVFLLDAAADLLVLERNFSRCLELCERGLQIITTEPGDSSSGQVKTSLCVIGIQALAELDRWREVLPWLVQFYRTPQELPPHIMEMCILLYSKVKQPRVMLELSSDWLRESSNQQMTGYGHVAELHLLHILLPLGLFSEAENLVQDPRVFSEEQKQVAFTVLSNRRSQWEREEDHAKVEKERPSQPEPDEKKLAGNTRSKVLNMVRLLYGALGLVVRRIGMIPLRQIIMVLVLISIIVLRLDPDKPIPSS